MSRLDTVTSTAGAGGLPWHDHAPLLGVGVRVYFFNPLVADAQPDLAARCLPILLASPAAVDLPRALDGTADGRRPDPFASGALQAQPDAVLRHGDGLICVMRRAGDGRLHDQAHWRGRLQVDLMLQSIATAMAVAGQTGLPTAAVWRAPNALYQFEPGLPVLRCLVDELPSAARYWGQAPHVTAAQLARFCEPRLRALMAEPVATPLAESFAA